MIGTTPGNLNADACNVGGEPETLRRKFGVLRGHCEALGRDYESITRSTNLLIYPLKPGEESAGDDRESACGYWRDL